MAQYEPHESGWSRTLLYQLLATFSWGALPSQSRRKLPKVRLQDAGQAWMQAQRAQQTLLRPLSRSIKNYDEHRAQGLRLR